MAEESVRKKRHALTRGMHFDAMPSCKVCPKRKLLSPMYLAHHVINRVSEDDEKNIILLRLLEYLGHPNPYVCAVAYNEVSNAE